MTKMTQAQADLLTRAGAEPGGVRYAPEDGDIARALIVKNLAISLPIVGGGVRLIITAAGCRALLARRGAADPHTAKGKADEHRHADAGGPRRRRPGVAGRPLASDVLESAPETSATEAPIQEPRPKGKLGLLVDLLVRPEGASVADMIAATGWQAHSIRGALSGSLKKQLGLRVESEKTGALRMYRIPA
jgi:hypothetical protein